MERTEKLQLGGVFKLECFNKHGDLQWEGDLYNAVVSEGLIDILGVTFGESEKRTWYLGLHTSMPTGIADIQGLTADDIGEKIAEFVNYEGSERPAYEGELVTGNSVRWSNASNAAEFKITLADNATVTVNGSFICSYEDKGAPDKSDPDAEKEVLLAIARFDTETGGRVVRNEDILRVTYVFTAGS